MGTAEIEIGMATGRAVADWGYSDISLQGDPAFLPLCRLAQHADAGKQFMISLAWCCNYAAEISGQVSTRDFRPTQGHPPASTRPPYLTAPPRAAE